MTDRGRLALGALPQESQSRGRSAGSGRYAKGRRGSHSPGQRGWGGESGHCSYGLMEIVWPCFLPFPRFLSWTLRNGGTAARAEAVASTDMGRKMGRGLELKENGRSISYIEAETPV